jgi:hypothetical protein
MRLLREEIERVSDAVTSRFARIGLPVLLAVAVLVAINAGGCTIG